MTTSSVRLASCPPATEWRRSCFFPSAAPVWGPIPCDTDGPGSPIALEGCSMPASHTWVACSSCDNDSLGKKERRVCPSEEVGTDAEPAETAHAPRESCTISLCSFALWRWLCGSSPLQMTFLWWASCPVPGSRGLLTSCL